MAFIIDDTLKVNAIIAASSNSIGDAGQVLTSNGSVIYWSSGQGQVPGSNGQLLFHYNESLGANNELYFYYANNTLEVSGNVVIANIATFNSNKHLILPRGTSLQRDAAPIEGHFRYNTDLNNLEWYNGTTWQQAGTSVGEANQRAFSDVSADTGTAASVLKTDTLTANGANGISTSATGTTLNINVQTGNTQLVANTTGLWVDQSKLTIIESQISDLKSYLTSSNTPVNGEIAVFTSGTDIEGDSNFTWDGSILDVNGKVDITNTNGNRPLNVIYTDNIQNQTHDTAFIRNDTSGSDAITGANKIKSALRLDGNHSGTGGTSVDGARVYIYGIYNAQDNSGDPYQHKGIYNPTTSNHSTGTVTNQYSDHNTAAGYNTSSGVITNNYGAYNDAIMASSGDITNNYGSLNRAIWNGTSSGNSTSGIGAYNQIRTVGGSTSTITTVRGTYSFVDLDGGTIGTVYAYRSNIDVEDTADVTGNAYLHHGTYAADTTVNIDSTSWGIYLDGEDKNYFSGDVGIGTTSPTSNLDVTGNITASTIVTGVEGIIGGGTGSVAYTSLNQIIAKGTGNAGIVIDSGTTSLGRVAFGDGALAGYVEYSHSDNSMRFSASAAERMRITSTGNVAIGTTTLNSNKAVIEGGSAGTHSSSLKLSTGDGASGLVSDLAFYGTFVTPTADKGPRRTADITSGFSTGNWGNEYLAFGVGLGGTVNDAASLTTERMRITSTGNVAIYGDLVPDTDNTGNVGTAALTWNNGQFTNLTIDTALTVNGLKDSSGDLGTSGQILSSTATGTNWINAPISGTGTVTSSNTPVNGEIAVFTSGTDIEGDTNLTWSGSILDVNGKVDITNTNGNRPLNVIYTDNIQNQTHDGALIQNNTSGSDAITGANKTKSTLKLDGNHSGIGGTTVDGARVYIYGIYNDQDNSGDPYQYIGIFNPTTSNHSTGTVANQFADQNIAGGYNTSTGVITNNYGAYNDAVMGSSGDITNNNGTVNRSRFLAASSGDTTYAHGAYNTVLMDVGSTSTITNTARGTLSYIDLNDGTAAALMAHYSLIDVENEADVTGSAYMYYGQYTAGSTANIDGTSWGVYLNGEDKNYFSNDVGIGTSSPGAKLGVNAGALGTSDGNQLELARFSSTNTNDSYLRIFTERDGAGSSWTTAFTRIQQRIDATDQGYIQFNGADNTYGTSFGNNNTEYMRIDSAGNVGIGDTNPTSHYGVAHRLVLRDDKDGITRVSITNATTGSSTASQYRMITGTGNSFMDFTLADNAGSPYSALSFGSAVDHYNITFGGSERMRIDSSGNVGIGTTSPSTLLDIEGNNTPDPLHVVRGGTVTSDQVGIKLTGTNSRWIGKGTDDNPYWATTNNISTGDKIYTTADASAAADTTTATADKLVLRTASGDDYRRYGYSSFLNMSHSVGARNDDTVFYSSPDGFIRKNNAASFRTSLDVYSKGEADSAFTGTVTSSNTPVNGEIAVFTSGTDIEGDTNFTWSGSILEVKAASNGVTDYPISITNLSDTVTTGYGVYGMAMPAGSEYTMDISGDLILDTGGDIFPAIHATTDLGSTSLRWKEIYSNGVDIGVTEISRPLNVVLTDTVQDANRDAAFIQNNISGTGGTTGNKTKVGLRLDINNSATESTTVSGERLYSYGVYNVQDNTGDLYNHTGLYSLITSGTAANTRVQYGIQNTSRTTSSGVITSNYGIYTDAQLTGSGDITNNYASYSRAIWNGTSSGSTTTGIAAYNNIRTIAGSTSTITSVRGTYTFIDLDAGTIGTVYAHYGNIDVEDTADVTGNAYMYYGSYAADTTVNIDSTSYGVYLTGEEINYFSAAVGIGTTTPSTKLDVAGSVRSIPHNIGTLTAASTTINFDNGNHQYFTINTTSAFTFNNPSNADVGVIGTIRIERGASVPTDFLFGTAWKFPSPGTVPEIQSDLATSGDYGYLDYYVHGATDIRVTWSGKVGA